VDRGKIKPISRGMVDGVDFCRIGYVYLLYDKNNDLDIRYVGQSVDPIKRLGSHIANSISGRKKLPVNRWIVKLLKSGSDVGMDILTACDYRLIDAIESFYISLFKLPKLFKIMNVSSGQGDYPGSSMSYYTDIENAEDELARLEVELAKKQERRVVSDETRARISRSKIGVPRPPATDSFRITMSNLMKGKPKSDLHREKLSSALKGALPPNTGKSKYYYFDTNKGVFLHDDDPLIASGSVYKKHDYRNRSWKRGDMYGKKIVVEEY